MAVIVVGIVALFVFWRPSTPPASLPETETGQPEASGGTGQPLSGKSGAIQPASSPAVSPKAPSQPVISVMAPASGESWSRGVSHMIRWSRPENLTGALVLLDAASNSTIGWISPGVSWGQVTYTWNTRLVMIGRNNPVTKNVEPGTYIVELNFDNSNISVRSAPFTIIADKNEVLLTRDISIYQNVYSPSYLKVSRGEYVIVTNNDPNASHILTLGGAAVITLAPHESYVFNTSKFGTGSYEFKIKGSTLATLMVVVE